MTIGRPRRATTAPRAWRVGVGLVVATACLGLFAWNAPWTEIGHVLREADPVLIALAGCCLLMTSVARAWRWPHLLRDDAVSFRHRLTSTYIGFAGNNTLPGRLGEPLRCLVLSRLERRIGFWHAAGSLVVERVFDLSAAIALLVAFLYLAPFPPDAAVRDAAFLARLEKDAAAIAGVLVLVVGILAVFARRRLDGGAGGWRARVTRRLASLQTGFAGLRSARGMAAASLLTVVLWTFMVLFELLMLRAFGFTELGIEHAIGLLVVLSFAIALPQAPAGVGVVQIASETTLTALYGMPIARAKAFAIGLWVCQVAIVVGAGVVALWVEGLSLGDVRRARGTIEELRGVASPE